MGGGGERDRVKPEVEEDAEMNPGEEVWMPLIVEGGRAIELSEYENSLLRAKILNLEQSAGLAAAKAEEMARKYSALVIEKKEMVERIEVLTEQRDQVTTVLDRELQNKRRELDVANRERDRIARIAGRERDELEEKNQQLVSQVILEKDNMRKGFEEEKAKLEKLELQFAGLEKKIEQSEAELGKLRSEREELSERNKELEGNVDEEKNQQLVSHVDHYRNVVDEIMLEKDEMRKGFEEEKAKVENFELQVAGLEKKIEQADTEIGKVEEKNQQLVSQVDRYRNVVDEIMLQKDEMRKGFEEEKAQFEWQVAGMEAKIEQSEAELGKMRSEREKLNERNMELESNVDVLMKEKEALQNTLLKAQRECNDQDKQLSKRNKELVNKLEKLELHVVGMEKKFEQADTELGEMKTDREKLNRRNMELESNVDVLMKEKEALQNTLRDSCSDSDPEFKYFGKDTAEECFAVNQCWAIYDDSDDFPRDYALIRKVASTPFELKVTWLEPDPDNQEEIDWYDEDLPIACGKFKVGDPEVFAKEDLHLFSHQIQCMKRIGKGSYLIYPNKGETWAVFRDWDLEWSSDLEDHSTDEFEYVEILSDFDENLGILVAYLVRVEGFESLFQKAKENGVNLYWVQPNELYRFSHQIPSYKRTCTNWLGVPRGCFEFDTDALPDNFSEDDDPTGLMSFKLNSFFQFLNQKFRSIFAR